MNAILTLAAFPQPERNAASVCFGLDFTSAPGRRKPITCVQARLSAGLLTVERCIHLINFPDFEDLLSTPGPWFAACDFPFGLPPRLLADLGWSPIWQAYIQSIANLPKEQFEKILLDYCAGRPAGDKHHVRLTDKLAGACSPMMLYRVPVAKMFFQGAPRLLASGVSIWPCFPRNDTRIVFEGYPSLMVRRWLGRRSYKSDERKKQSNDQRLARVELLTLLCSPLLQKEYGIELSLASEIRQELEADATGDQLDALLCAIQAAWASQQPGYGIPEGHASEGWIVDPALLKREAL
ncbi:DUF429 domain-containing protein [Tengunoibacter tsumagoiensis]|uniref:DUF429 domain-containing protein n=1 Tax=Tengunoibacter tsumagoiensis TaxID=2014871 RepID=A0A401ZXS9_9CHLR|nr:DUF429 domain-containing protein [Tengunoibacter tsumagoiensis]GCE11642.1 hypothetical protein KTT_15010 [Tengunoibacter tsumagoiensis]